MAEEKNYKKEKELGIRWKNVKIFTDHKIITERLALNRSKIFCLAQHKGKKKIDIDIFLTFSQKQQERKRKHFILAWPAKTASSCCLQDNGNTISKEIFYFLHYPT